MGEGGSLTLIMIFQFMLAFGLAKLFKESRIVAWVQLFFFCWLDDHSTDHRLPPQGAVAVAAIAAQSEPKIYALQAAGGRKMQQ